MAKEKTEAQMKMDDAAAGAVKELAPIIKNGSAVDLVKFHQKWYLKAGHKRLGQLYRDAQV